MRQLKNSNNSMLVKWLGSICFLMLSNSALAEGLQLVGDRSSLSFVSIKNNSLAELHSFTQLAGQVNENGTATINITLDSIESGIGIRNQRMRDMLFETTNYKLATVSAKVELSAIRSLAAGDSIIQPLELMLDLHGQQQTITAQVSITATDDGHWRVRSERPIMLIAQLHNLHVGIEKLREVAGLSAIATSVPVDFNLVFK